jgi:hypothetical protein
MEAKLGKAERKAFKIANLLEDAADAIRKRSKRAYRAGEISLEDYMEARAKELELRAEVSVVVASDLLVGCSRRSRALKRTSSRRSARPRAGVKPCDPSGKGGDRDCVGGAGWSGSHGERKVDTGGSGERFPAI